MRSVDDLSEELRNHLDLFPSFKYFYSSVFPQAHRSGFVDLVLSEKGKARVSDVARSHSIWLAPVDAPKELYKHRLRINRIIKWAYKNNFVPVLMTLTIYHRRNHLDGLNYVLGDSWRDLLSGYSGRRRIAAVCKRFEAEFGEKIDESFCLPSVSTDLFSAAFMTAKLKIMGYAPCRDLWC